MFHSFFRNLLLVWGLISLAACTSKQPSDVLSEDKMEDVLYDYHLAQGMATQHPSDSIPYLTQLYREAVFAKYGIKQADFDRSMEWYTRNMYMLSAIYERVGERLGETKNVGKGSRSIARSGGQQVMGDTAEVWQGAPSLLLSSHGEQHYVFHVAADTSYRPNDRIEWSFDVNWHYHEGNRQAVAVLGLCYEGDTVMTTTQRIYQSGENRLTHYVERDRKLKSIVGLVYQATEWTERPRLLSLKNFSLRRIRTTLSTPSSSTTPGSSTSGSTTSGISATPGTSTPGIPLSPSQLTIPRSDSLSVRPQSAEKRIRDSLHRAEKMRAKGAHFRK